MNRILFGAALAIVGWWFLSRRNRSKDGQSGRDIAREVINDPRVRHQARKVKDRVLHSDRAAS